MAATAGTVAVHGTVVGLVLAASGILAVTFTAGLAMKKQTAGHAYFYWQLQGAKNGDPVDLTTPLDNLDELMARSRSLQS